MREWLALLALTTDAFTRPAFRLFQQLATAWILCPTRRTITGMIGLIPPEDRQAHDAYHRLLRAARWSLCEVWRLLVRAVVTGRCPEGRIELVVDDTLAHKTGRKVADAGSFRDPVLSTKNRTVFVHGLNAVVLAIRIHPSLGRRTPGPAGQLPPLPERRTLAPRSGRGDGAPIGRLVAGP